MSEEDLSIFEYATDGGEWIITCLANETFRVTTSTQEAADALVDSFNRAFMIGMANARNTMAEITNNMAAQIWPNDVSEGAITPLDDVIDEIILDDPKPEPKPVAAH